MLTRNKHEVEPKFIELKSRIEKLERKFAAFIENAECKFERQAAFIERLKNLEQEKVQPEDESGNESDTEEVSIPRSKLDKIHRLDHDF